MPCWQSHIQKEKIESSYIFNLVMMNDENKDSSHEEDESQRTSHEEDH